MQRFEIHRVLATGISEVATFVHTQESPISQTVGSEARNLETRLRWLLVENPVATSGSPCGFCIRDSAGVIKGVTLCFPSAFLAGDRRLLGLGSGGFFVAPEARTMGFYLFREYLKSDGYSLFFTTTCNSNSAALWQRLGGCAIANSDVEYVLPLKMHRLLPALMAEKMSSGVALAVSHIFERFGDRAPKFSGRRAFALKVSHCHDWQKLSHLFERCRRRDSITADRSPEFLRWRYGQSSDPCPSGVYLFSDRDGNEGWFALGSAVRGRWGQIRGSVLLDAVWPREKISFREIFTGIVHLAESSSDVLLLRPRPGIDFGKYGRWVIRRRRFAASSFAITRNGDERLTAAALDLTSADGDSALPLSPVLRSELETGGTALVTN